LTAERENADQREGDREPSGRWLTPGVGGVGLTSFFSDAGHEIDRLIHHRVDAARQHAADDDERRRRFMATRIAEATQHAGPGHEGVTRP
jgi:hypothetical protein